MQKAHISRIAQAWIQHHLIVENETNALGYGEKNEYEWAYDTLLDLIQEKNPISLDIILQIIAFSENDKILGNIGAGPLEDLLHESGNDIIDRLESECANNKRLVIALSYVYFYDFSEKIVQRIKKITNENYKNHVLRNNGDEG